MLSAGHPFARQAPSMKVPPKRKGNVVFEDGARLTLSSLNESPSEKEGKLAENVIMGRVFGDPSMKVPPKRKGNPASSPV